MLALLIVAPGVIAVALLVAGAALSPRRRFADRSDRRDAAWCAEGR